MRPEDIANIREPNATELDALRLLDEEIGGFVPNCIYRVSFHHPKPILRGVDVLFVEPVGPLAKVRRVMGSKLGPEFLIAPKDLMR